MFADIEAMVGQTIADHRLVRVLGLGGMGAVFLGEHLDEPDMRVAIKVLLPSRYTLPEMRASFHARFMREAQAMSQLHHSHIVPILSYGEWDTLPYIVMNYLPGGTLSARLQEQRKPLSFAEITRYLTQLASALDYAHKQGIVHRDIKPGNVLLDEHGDIFLSDFGIAHFMKADPELLSTNVVALTVAGEMFGTPSYMAPELFRGEEAEPAADVYALGIMLYQLITGRVPFQGKGPLDVGIKHLNETPLPPRAFRPDLPEPAEAALLRALAKFPTERFASVGELSYAFRAGLRGLWPVSDTMRVPQQLKTRAQMTGRSISAYPVTAINKGKSTSLGDSVHGMRGAFVAVVLILILGQALAFGIMAGIRSFGSSAPLSTLSVAVQKTQVVPSPTPHSVVTPIPQSIQTIPSPTEAPLPTRTPPPAIVTYNPANMHLALSNNTLYAFNGTATTASWTYTTINPLVRATLIAGNNVYLVTKLGQLYALSLKDGTLLWSYNTGVPTSSPLKMQNSTVIMSALNSTLYEFEASSGELLFVMNPTPAPEATPTPEVTPTPQATSTPQATPTPEVTPPPEPNNTPSVPLPV